MSLFALVLLVGCDGGIEVNPQDSGLEEEIDEDPPVIVHTPVDGTQTFGSDVAIEATVTDEDSGVLFVYIFYKNEVDGPADWEKDMLISAGDGKFTGRIPGDGHNSGGVDYYLEAVDREQNTVFSPKDGEEDPYHYRLAE